MQRVYGKLFNTKKYHTHIVTFCPTDIISYKVSLTVAERIGRIIFLELCERQDQTILSALLLWLRLKRV